MSRRAELTNSETGITAPREAEGSLTGRNGVQDKKIAVAQAMDQGSGQGIDFAASRSAPKEQIKLMKTNKKMAARI